MAHSTNSYVALVDDDESVRRSFGRLLRAAGFQPVTYASAEAFLADVKRPCFDCLVFDIQLEGTSGVELGRQLASAGSMIPLIFITAYDEQSIREQAEAIPCFAYLRKTEPAESVLATIRRAIEANAAGSTGTTERG